MIVSLKNFKDILFPISWAERLSLDCETTGLYPYKDDVLFSIIIGIKDTQFYFNFNQYPDFDSEFVLPREYIKGIGNALNMGATKTLYLHNSKFDLAFLAKEGVFIEPHHTIHDTEVVARLIRSDYESYSLDSCARRIGFEKSDAVMEYLKKEKLFEYEETPGKKKREKKYFFDKVPPEVIVPYGKVDAQITYELGEWQLKQLVDEKELALYRNETALTRVCLAMEQRGIKIDRAYCEVAKAHELKRCEIAAQRFKELTGINFVDSGKTLAEVFAKENIQAPRTEKGNPSFTDSALATIKHPISDVVREHREAYKKANTYYANFLSLADKDDVLHASIRQSATFTGRFAYSEPNLQNVPKEEEGEFKIRRAFIPREGFSFYELDYKTQEFRLLLDYAGERELCQRIIDGYDAHQATADLVKIERKKAKTLNFALLYGMGIEKLSKALGVSLDEARAFKQKYFGALPRVQNFIRQATHVATQRGYVKNWAGKKYFFPDSKFAYKSPNALIQGGSAEIIKFAMPIIEDFLKPHKTKMVLQVHDSLLLEVFRGEEHLIEEVKKIMISTYKHTYLPMDVSVGKSESSWVDVHEI